MGREIRKVPPNWQHPTTERYGRTDPQPMYDERFEDAAERWKRGFAEHVPTDNDGLEYWEYDSEPPEREYYRPWKDEEATWFQCWQTVSEGTPVSPPFATLDELAAYLAENGDFWDQKRGHGGWGKASADAFCKEGWAPSMIVVNTPTESRIIESKDVAAHFAKAK